MLEIEEDYDDSLSSKYIDLLSDRLGGQTLNCSDDWFAAVTHLVKPGRGVFEPGTFSDTGAVFDGWETRRSFGRDNGREYDWAILKMGVPGVIRGFDIDTNHFKGNAPEQATVEACFIDGRPDENTAWVEILSSSDLEPHSQNLFEINNDNKWNFLRLNIFPDGGVARFRAYGEPRVDMSQYIEGELIDLAAVIHGGRGLLCSDMFFSSPDNILMPGRGVNMGDGWETKRRRDDKNDWNIVKLGMAGTIRKVLVDTIHFKGNFPDSFSLEATNTERDDIDAADIEWESVVPQTKLYADEERIFVKEVQADPETVYTHVRVNIYPDGGLSRLRVFGFPK